MMSIADFIFFMCFVTLIAGGMGYLLWIFFSKCIGKNYPILCYRSLKLACIFSFLPFIYFMVLFFHQGIYREEGSPWKSEFSTNYFMRPLIVCFIALWICSILISLYKNYQRTCEWRELNQYNKPLDKYDKILKNVCRILEIRANIQLYENAFISIPLIYGIRHPIILLPERDYTPSEMEMILFHELSHHKNADLQWKWITKWVLVFQTLNPFMASMLNAMDRWGEICCDITVRQYAKEYFSTKDYFSMLLKQAEEITEGIEKKCDSAALFEKKPDLEERIEIMKKYMKTKKYKKQKEWGVGFIFVVMFMAITYLTGVVVQVGAEEIFDHTSPKTVECEPQALPEYVEVTTDLEEEGYTLMEMPDSVTRGTRNINWNIPAKTIAYTSEFSMSKGDKLTITILIEPDNQTVETGYINSSNKKTGVSGKAVITHTFTIPATGKYRVYAKNEGNKKVSVKGAYSR